MINPNQYLRWLLSIVPCQLLQEIWIKGKNIVSLCLFFSKIPVIRRDLAWPRKSPKFNLHHLQNISTGFKMAVLTPKSGIVCNLTWIQNSEIMKFSFILVYTFWRAGKQCTNFYLKKKVILKQYSLCLLFNFSLKDSSHSRHKLKPG